MLEFYDFITYSFFAIQIGHTFFPTGSEYGSLRLLLATFGAGFVTRPIGGIVLGIYSDRIGRRPAMLLTIALIGLSILTIALTPSLSIDRPCRAHHRDRSAYGARLCPRRRGRCARRLVICVSPAIIGECVA